MPTLEELLVQQAELQKQIDQMREEGKREAIREMKANMAKYGITCADLQCNSSVKPPKAPKTPTVVKYRKSDTETWVGRGPKPQWVKDVEAIGGNLNDYLVKEA
jgi:DNA-binding protein H-NS